MPGQRRKTTSIHFFGGPANYFIVFPDSQLTLNKERFRYEQNDDPNGQLVQLATGSQTSRGLLPV